jgi:hypothetical protein
MEENDHRNGLRFQNRYFLPVSNSAFKHRIGVDAPTLPFYCTPYFSTRGGAGHSRKEEAR